MESEWITSTEAAEILGIVRHNLWRRVQQGTLPSTKYGVDPRNKGRKLALFLRSEVEHNRDTYFEQRGPKKRPDEVILDVSPTDAAYMAGLIDGEGSITIINWHGNSYGLTLSVTNTHEGVLLWCHQVFGGSTTRVIRKAAPREGHSQGYAWQCRSTIAVAVLDVCLPYFKIKREQALLAIEFMVTYPPAKARGLFREDLPIPLRRRLAGLLRATNSAALIAAATARPVVDWQD